MQHALLVKSMLAGAAILGIGGVAGVSLANYASSGSFEFYRQASISGWRSGPALAAAERRPMLASVDDPAVRLPDPEILPDRGPR